MFLVSRPDRIVSRIGAALAVALAVAVPGPPTAGATASAAAAPSPGPSGFDEAEYRRLDEQLRMSRARKAADFAIDPARGIDEARFVRLGGIDQWVTIRGENRANPVLLFVHGGPGDVTSLWSYPYFAAWEQFFTVVQWDQRGAGRTFGRSGPSVRATMTVARMAQDGIELTQYLERTLRRHAIVVVAHSFGTLLALRMVRERPDLFSAYVGTGQVADETRNYAVAYGALLREARARGNGEAVAQLVRVGPPPYTSYRGYQVQRRWSNRFEGADRFLPGTLGLALVSPGYSARDLSDDLDGQLFSGDALVPKIRSATMRDLGLRFAIPIFFFEGTHDFTTPTALAHDYLRALRAPRKAFVPIAGGHFAVFLNSDDFLRELRGRVRPLARAAG